MSAQQESWESVTDHAEFLAERVWDGFVAHDQRDRMAAVKAFATVDSSQFQHVDDATARRAAVAYVNALWKKDEVEDAHETDGEFDREALDAADWGPVHENFAERARLLGIDEDYADLSTTAWRRHKTGGDYWTPIMRAQMLELRVALGDPEYPRKPRYGQSGFGPEATRYALAVELHDYRSAEHLEQGKDVMVPYYEAILRAHE
ncbi:hypothetical protein [Halorientalis pallida]|uniref:Uncharacterized protein n=1 Tax=Halorientalis pallida TaxID=2479928 RepID=A0A498KWJ6_9EURY|nr:hypothetical protein [Halorientalis pallida]RXK49990.1 hypothetical protein EAF64_05310 [Halorientalis pallida]